MKRKSGTGLWRISRDGREIKEKARVRREDSESLQSKKKKKKKKTINERHMKGGEEEYRRKKGRKG